MNKNHETIQKITISAMLLTLALLLPFLTAQNQLLGNMISPMHLPIFICGVFCGVKYGAVVGFVAPLLRSAIFNMPPFYPVAITMAFELSAYGALIGVFKNVFEKTSMKKVLIIYIALVISMLLGRMVSGIVGYILSVFDESQVFTFQTFISGSFIVAWPGIVIQLIIIPSLYLALDKVKRKEEAK